MEIAPVGNSAPALPAGLDIASPKWLTENRELIRSVKSINATELFGEGAELTFAVDRESQQPVVRVLNQQTGELLWQTPPEYMLRLAEILGQPPG